MTQRLLLVGGGHAHLGVLDALGRAPLLGADGKPWELTLLSPYERQIYSGMLPGWIAGHYRLEQCAIPLRPLAQRAGGRYLQDQAVGIDLNERRVLTAAGAALPFDLVALDIGPAPDLEAIPGTREHAIPLRPIENFIVAWQRLQPRLAAARVPTTVSVIGGGAGGVEIALALAWRLRAAQPRATVQLICGRPGLLPSLPPAGAERIARCLHRQGIAAYLEDAVAVEAAAVRLKDGAVLKTDATLVAIGAAAATWPGAAGLAVDGRGFIAVNEHLQSTSHPFLFAAGDCATMLDQPRPKSGVYAVRAGPPLTANLRRAAAGQPLAPYRPQRRALYLLSTGGRHAIGLWGRLAFAGDWVWRWKDRIDRRFMAKYGASS
jgi:pyridine nucleotide-disulfide oxidoreductase family protein